MTMRCTLPPSGRAAASAAQFRAAIPVIETERLSLRAPAMDDFPLWAEIFAEEEGDHLGGPLSDEDVWLSFAAYAASWLLQGSGLFTVEHSGEPVGFVTLALEWEDEEPELGWLFPKRFQGQGFAFEAASAVRAMGAQLFGEGYFVSYIAPTNAASARLAARLKASRDASAEARLGCQVWRHGSAS